MAAFVNRSLNETSGGHPRRVDTAFASAALFPMLGVEPRFGRLFTAANEKPGNDRVVLLTDDFFDRHCHRNPSCIGSTLTIDGAAYTILGVLPPRFHLPATHEGSDQIKAEVWVPLSRLPEPNAANRAGGLESSDARELRVAARLKPTATLAQARIEMAAIAERLAKSAPESNEGWTTSVFDFRTEDTEPQVHRALYVLMGAVGFLLLIACANLANLTMARATLRSRELAVRLALGATRARLLRQLIAEPLVLSLTGAAVGLLLARWSST